MSGRLRGSGLAVTLLGAVVMIGWYAHWTPILQVLPGLATMKYNSALCFFLCGIALMLLTSRYRLIALLPGGITLLVGLSSLSEYIWGRGFGIDEFFVSDYMLALTSFAGRMSPLTAWCFMLLGAGLTVSARFEGRWPTVLSGMMACVVAAIAAISLLGYLLGSPVNFTWSAFMQMALHAAVALLVLGLALLAWTWQQTKRATFEFTGWLPISASVTTMAMMAVVLSGNMADVNNAFDWRKHSSIVLMAAQTLQIDLADMAAHATMPGPTSSENARQHLDQLRLLTRDNPAQQWRLRTLATDIPESLTAAELGPTLARARANLQAFIDAERRLLVARDSTAQASLHGTTRFLMVSCMLAVILLVIAYLLARREMRRSSRTELKLDNVSRLQAAILNAANYAFISFSLDGTVTSFNSTAERWLGYSAADAIGQPPFRWHDAAEVAARADQLTKELGYPVAADFHCLVAKARVGLRDENEWMLIRKDASRFPVSLSVTALGTVSGTLSGYVCVIADITERQQVDRMKSEFISTVSHELRTPLTSIRGALGLIEGGVLGKLPEKAASMVKIAHQNSQRLVNIINDILDIETMESGNLDLHLGRVPVAEFLRQALEGNQGYGTKYQVRFELEEVPEGGVFLADPHRLMQVMANLLSNAAKYSPFGAAVRVRARLNGMKLRVEVEDRGAGIPEEFRQRIFEKFAQADSSTSRRFEGTGLGLSITRQLVLAMGGTIGFDSELGRGTVFFFELPQAGAESAAMKEIEALDTGRFARLNAGRADAAPLHAGPPRILHVEDDLDFSRVIEAALGESVQIVNARTLESARALLLEQSFSLIVLDPSLPDGNSLGLLDTLRVIGGRTVPVVILSSAEVSRKVKSRVAGVLIKSRVSEAVIVRTVLKLVFQPPI